ncbi:alpha-xenorhabdolysin family binary toxin subunit B [Pseudomonas atagonensis]|uniref:alpha-xenorhabdolysin family binary toxin subunit B n=1 Tax=Pseudomonas atagonensis TaxID=2609964 RepID=UPI0014099084|nr:alpha-xenorhabdolysin family binary toxin subunit B [Pseudomonas atagonensis]
MNGVTPINTPSIPVVDVKNIVQTIRDISTLARFRNVRSDVLQERAQQVAAYLNNTDQTLREAFPILLTALSNATGDSYFTALDELRDALTREDLSEDDRTLLSGEIRNLKGLVEAMFERVEARFTECAQRLNNDVRSVYSVEIGARADEPLNVAKQRKARILALLDEHSRNKATCVEQRDTLIKAQDVIREFNLADMYKNYIPTGKELDSLDMENPKKEAVKQGIELVRKVLGVVSGGIKYIELATSRNNLDQEIQSISQTMDALNHDLQGAEDVLSDANAIVEIGRQRRIAGEEIAAVANIWSGFAVAVERLKGSDYAPSDWSSLVNRYRMHLQSLSTEYNALMIN